MDTRKWINNCFAGCISASLIGTVVSVANADSGFIPQAHIKTRFSSDLESLNYSSTQSFQYQLEASEPQPKINIGRYDSTFFQRQAGIAMYKAFSLSKNKLQSQLAGAAMIYGLNELEVSASLKTGFLFLKEKTRFNFGKCSQVRLSTKRLKARSCFNKNAKIEFHANYKMDSFKLNFLWPL